MSGSGLEPSQQQQNWHTFQAPIGLGAGARFTPFAEARLTAWDEGLDPEDQPTRAALLGGAESV